VICEICGKTDSRGFKVKIEGTTVSACPSCAAGHNKVAQVTPERKRTPPKKMPQKKREFRVDQEFDIDDEYGSKIKKAREKRGMTMEELGKMVNESESLIHRMELGKYEPPPEMAKKLEKKLGIKLISPHHDPEEQMQKTESKDLTLGDMIVVRKKDK